MWQPAGRVDNTSEEASHVIAQQPGLQTLINNAVGDILKEVAKLCGLQTQHKSDRWHFTKNSVCLPSPSIN